LDAAVATTPSPPPGPAIEDPIEIGRDSYQRRGCVACHSLDGTIRVAPSWKGLWGKTVALEGGGTVVVDEAFVRESILQPQAKLEKGYPASMPSYEGALAEAELAAFVALIKSLQ
jgi:cytochrome c oxidase subunit 2